MKLRKPKYVAVLSFGRIAQARQQHLILGLGKESLVLLNNANNNINRLDYRRLSKNQI